MRILENGLFTWLDPKCQNRINYVIIYYNINYINFLQEWNSDKLPVYEPGLDDVIRECRGRNLVS
jgi:hypothetical protein